MKYFLKSQSSTVFFITVVSFWFLLGSILFVGLQQKEKHKATSQTSSTTSPSSSPTVSIAPSESPRSGSPSVPLRVVTVTYLPENNGVLDTENAIQDRYHEYDMTIDETRQKVALLTQRVMQRLTEGTRFHGYKQPDQLPYIQYELFDSQEFLEAVPLGQKQYNGLPLPDYHAMMQRIDVCNYVDTHNVREIWLWTYGGVGKSGWETNFSSSHGDISNSDRDVQDLPLCQHSYTVYDYNYGRGESEALENHVHQLEVLFGFIDRDLFWNRFVGYFPGGNWTTSSASTTNRRCGWAHFPPNGERDYDWTNNEFVLSDCEDWNPDGFGTATRMNCSRWGCSSVQFFEWWMQNIPGQDNPYVYQGNKVRNWWEFVADFDGAMSEKKGLVE